MYLIMLMYGVHAVHIECNIYACVTTRAAVASNQSNLAPPPPVLLALLVSYYGREGR